MTSRVLVRKTAGDDMAFEIIHINHDDRFRLRRLLLDEALHHSGATAPVSPDPR